MSFGKLGALGRGFGRLGGALGSSGIAPSVPDAPNPLVWTSAQSDNTPDFTVTMPANAADLDAIYLEIADNIAFTTTSEIDISAGDVAGAVVAISAGVLADGVWYARARLKRGSNYSAYTNIVTVTISTFVPRTFMLGGPFPTYISTTAARSYSTATGHVTETA